MNKLLRIPTLLLSLLFGLATVICCYQHSLADHRPPVLIALEKKEYQQAAALLLEDASHGKSFSQWAYAELLQMGVVSDTKPEQAVEWYRKAADNGYRPALISMHTVSPKPVDFLEVGDTDARLLHIRAVAGDPEACLDLALWFHERTEEEQSRYWLIQSTSKIDKKNVHKGYHAAQILFSEGVGQDQLKALEIMRELAARGYAFFELGQMLEKAEGKLNNPWEAEQWYRRAAEAGNANAQVRMGEMYREGDLIGIKSEREALRWFKKAMRTRKNGQGYDYIPPESRLAVLYNLGKDGFGGFSERMEANTTSETELTYLMHENYDFQSVYYATAIALRNAKYDFAIKEAASAAEDGKRDCSDSECYAMTAWFQLLSGKSKEVLDNVDLLNAGNAKSHFHLGHALLLQERTAEALEQYSKGLAKATLHERYLLDDELDLLSWQFSLKHLLIAATRLTLNKESKLFSEESILRLEEVKALKASMVRGRIMKEIKP